MNLVWCSWKDINHPQAGGAEIITHNILTRLVRDGHNVTLLTAKHSNPIKTKSIYSTKSMGNRYTVYFKVYNYYRNNLRDTTDTVVDEMNTIPFFIAKAANKKTRRYLFVHQLCREIWFYQMIFPFSAIGYMLEPLYLRLLAKYNKDVITVSNSTKNDLIKHGFNNSNISIISEGIEMKPIDKLPEKLVNQRVNILSLGALRPMKRTLETLKSYRILLEDPEMQSKALHLHIVGDSTGKYAEKVIKYAEMHLPEVSYTFHGRVSKDKKALLMMNASLITVTSVKEGWGLIVTEANSQGTPAVVYDVDGLRDSVINKKTGIVSKPNPTSLTRNIKLLTSDNDKYQIIRNNAWYMSKDITFEKSYSDFNRIINKEPVK